MPFEFDPQKSDSNREKHGIDFEEAQALMNRGFWSSEKFRESAGRLSLPIAAEIFVLYLSAVQEMRR